MIPWKAETVQSQIINIQIYVEKQKKKLLEFKMSDNKK